MRHYSDFFKSYLKFTAGHEGSQRFHLWTAISIVAASLERKVWMDRGYYTLFPNLYIFLIGKSGLVKKSTTTGIGVNLLRKLSDVKMMSERLTPASLISQLHKSQKTFSIDGEEVQQSPLYAYASELSVFMQEVAGSISELLTTFYDCIPNDPKQPWVYDTKSQGKEEIYGPCLNILGASTKAWLKKAIPSSEMEGGFSSRIIFVVENQIPKNFVAWPKLSPELIRMRGHLEETLAHIHELSGEVKVTPAAMDAFEEFYLFHMRNVVPACADPRMAGYMGRKGDLVLKLAMVRSASLRDDLTIEASDILWAGGKLSEIEQDMQDSFEGIGSSQASSTLFEIRNFIKSKGSVDRVEIKRQFAKDAQGKEIDQILQDLVDMQVIVREEPSGKNVRYSIVAAGAL